MGVKIEGMQLPESCDDCPFVYISVNGDRVCHNMTTDETLIVDDLILCRHDECPLEEVEEKTKTGWISVKDRLPDKVDRYLTCDKFENIHVFIHTPKYEYPFGISENHPLYYPVKWWMPISKPPMYQMDDGRKSCFGQYIDESNHICENASSGLCECYAECRDECIYV